jgi:uncharacterized protein YhbP (UPF0306 family)
MSKISDFIQKNKVASISSVDEDAGTYSFNCFYAFDKETMRILFKSSSTTHHASLFKINNNISGTILQEKISLIKLQGIQFKGLVNNKVSEELKNIYYKKYPFALAMQGEIYCIDLYHIKMKDNSKTFGEKLEWVNTELKV